MRFVDGPAEALVSEVAKWISTKSGRLLKKRMRDKASAEKFVGFMAQACSGPLGVSGYGALVQGVACWLSKGKQRSTDVPLRVNARHEKAALALVSFMIRSRDIRSAPSASGKDIEKGEVV